MTNREFYSIIASTSTLADEVRSHAQAQLDKMDASNAKNRGTESKTYKANLPLMAEVLEILEGGAMTTVEVATVMSSEGRPISTSKASGLLRTLEKEGQLTSTKIKVKGKGEQTQYALAT